MDPKSFHRKLAAILSADVAGYSRLMQDDEAATVATLESYKQAFFDLIKQHRGRLVDSPGDNLLAEFASVVDAVQCAVAVQKELQARNAEWPENRKMQFRIGVNLGDVIEEGERIYGDGVNIAARLESLAHPGGICISKTAFDQIETKLPFGYEFLGEQKVKNIAKPVGTCRVLMEPRVTKGKGARYTVQGSRRRILIIGLAGVLLIIAGVALRQFFLRLSPQSVEKADPQKMAFPLPDKPSLAVLPFSNLSDDPKQELFSDGLSEEIINALVRLPQVFVIARNSSFAYKGKAPDLRQVGRELGTKYVLEGSVRREGDRVRITAQLIDAATGSHVFSERYDRKFADVFTLQDEITLKILVALQVKLTEGERAVALAKGTQNLDAYMKVMEARACANRFTPEANALARQAAEEALALDPNYPMAYLRLSATYLMEHSHGSGEPFAGTLRKAEELVQKALALDENLAEGHAFMGRIYLTRGQHDEAVKRGEQAVALAPNSDFALAALAFTLRYCGAPQEAIGLYRKAMRLNPLPPSWYFTGLGSCYFDLARYEDAIGETKKSLKDSPDNLPAHLILAAAYSMAGRSAEAQAEAAEVLRIEPKFSLDRFTRTRMYKEPSDAERFHAALRRAGIR